MPDFDGEIKIPFPKLIDVKLKLEKTDDKTMMEASNWHRIDATTVGSYLTKNFLW